MKLRAPALRPITIRRPRLTAPLLEAHPRIVVVVAPPGFGKTSLLADWSERDGRRFAWVNVDQLDNDPTLFWGYVAGAAAKSIGEPLSGERLARLTRDPDPVASIAATLDTGHETVLVLDDYFFIENESIHDNLYRFTTLAPPTVTVALASRIDPPLPLARLRASGELVEIRADDLRFTPEESREFLNGSLGLSLDDPSVETLHARTEGWPAGLYLAYLGLQGAEDPQSFVDRFGASNRQVGDYLTEQVLAAQDPGTLEFMLATSIVDRMSGPLADALVDASASAARLDALERANVFLTPLDDGRDWYRYHHLLRELLLMELRRRAPESEAALHVRASEWFETVGDPERAISHAIGARDVERAARLITEHYVRYIEWGRLATIAGWLDRLGSEVIEADARLSVVKAWTMHFLGRRIEADRALEGATLLAYEGHQPDGAVSMESTAALMAAAFPGGDVGKMLRSARRAFELESTRQQWRIPVHVMVGFALVRAGEFEEADPYLARGEELALEAEMWMDAIGAGSLRARVALERGEHTEALQRARAAVDLAGRTGVGQTATGAYARQMLGAVLDATGRHAEAVDRLTEAIGPLRVLDEPMPLAEALLWLARAQGRLGHGREAERALAEADALIAAMSDPGHLRTMRRATGERLRRRVSAADTPLSTRELQVLRLLAMGLSKRQIASRLFVSFNTVHSHIRTIYRKLEVGTKDEAITRARERGLIPEA